MSRYSELSRTFPHPKTSMNSSLRFSNPTALSATAIKNRKATFVSTLGVDGARHEARRVTDRALSRLDSFGTRADELRSVAEFVLARNT